MQSDSKNWRKRAITFPQTRRLYYVSRSTLFDTLWFFVAIGMMAFTFALTQSAGAAKAQNDAAVRVVHASPGAGTVDGFVDGSTLLSNFGFGTIPKYVMVAAGSHTIKVAPAGKGISAAVITQSVTVNAGSYYTVAALGTSASDFALAAFVDTNTVSSDKAAVRVYHLSPDAGPVDVAAGSSTVISGLTYKSASNYLSVPGGSYTFNVTATTSGAKVPLPETLQSGMVYSIFAVGLLKGTPALAFKVAAVASIPGMPNTGSDPSAASVTPGIAYIPWLLGALFAVLLASGGFVMRRSLLSRQK
ncbi:MAG TPA: DUF4397 domain-containing protein [Ktedonobacteraceae bacterium]